MTARTFTEFLRDKTGGANWVVTPRLTDRMRGAGYTLALPPKRYAELEREWEIETYGAPLASLQDAAPALLAALKRAVDQLSQKRAKVRPNGRRPLDFDLELAIAEAGKAIDKAEGRT